MKNIQSPAFLCAGILVVLVLMLSSTAVMAGYDYIDITNPFLKKIPIAIPRFKNMVGTSPAETLSVEGARLTAATLEFSGYFKIMDPAAFLENPHEKGITQQNITFKNWSGIGAEMLITGGVVQRNGLLALEMRLFDTFNAKLLIGKRYLNVDDKNTRATIRKFCGEVVKMLTGNYGLFESKIAFISNGTGAKEIFTCDFDGYNPVQITNTKTITLSPAWSSDGNYLAYTDYSRGKPDLFIKHLKEKKGWVVDKEGSNITPAWQPGSFSLAATLSFSGDPEIYMLTGTGKIIKRLTKNWGIDVSPAFSPDGRKIAFVSKRSGTPQIYIKDLDTGQNWRLTYEGRYNTSPAWSPTGEKIAYASMVNGVFDIFVIGTDGSNPTALTVQSGDNESPTWSPDGSLIAFSSTREGVTRIYVMTASGTDQRRLLTLPGHQTQPKWSNRIINN